MNWKVPYIDLKAQFAAHAEEYMTAMRRVMASGRYIGGEEVERFEASMAAYLGVRYVVSCGNGYDALFLALKARGVERGHRVLTDSYTHISTHAAILNIGAGVVTSHFGGADFYLPVHMNGRMHKPNQLYGDLPVIEDACQAIGTAYDGLKAGTWGQVAAFSLHPMKVLGCSGDGGFVSTSHRDIAKDVMDMRNHGGGRMYGVNSRLDAIQAALLNVKLPYLDGWIKRRREIAAIYEAELPPWVKKPPAPSDGPYFDTYSSYVIGGSPELLQHMRDKGIECFSHIRNDVVSLPIYQEMKDAHVAMVIAAIKSYING